MQITHNVLFRVIDKGTGKVVREYEGHNQATNTMLTGIGHYLAGDGTTNANAILGAFVPKYISLGTMGLINQKEDEIAHMNEKEKYFFTGTKTSAPS